MAAQDLVTLDHNTASCFADCALHCLGQRYPFAMQHLRTGDNDTAAPHVVHPMFFGSYDWHSSVHMHWSLIRLLRNDPNLPQRAAIHQHFASRFTAANARAEFIYLLKNPNFERPYGWGWLLQLHSELLIYATQYAPAQRWAKCLLPLVTQILENWCRFLSVSHYPQRAGTHANSAFAMTLAWRYANQQNNKHAQRAMSDAARRWFDDDKKYPAEFEPSGSDFLSAGLCEALLMSEVRGKQFGDWWKQFKPNANAIKTWLEPVVVGSRTDGQLVHLDGLNLSRAWCLRTLAAKLPQHHVAFTKAAERHLAASMPHVTGGDFVATHWLVSFALLAMTDVPMSGKDLQS